MLYLDLKFDILRRFPRQFDFAREAGVHESLVSAVINGRRKISREEAERWSRILGCGVEDLAPVIAEESRIRAA